VSQPAELDAVKSSPASMETLWKLVEIPFMHQAKCALRFIKKLPGTQERISSLVVITYVDDRRESKAFSGVCDSLSVCLSVCVSVCLSVCLSVRTKLKSPNLAQA